MVGVPRPLHHDLTSECLEQERIERERIRHQMRIGQAIAAYSGFIDVEVPGEKFTTFHTLTALRTPVVYNNVEPIVYFDQH